MSERIEIDLDAIERAGGNASRAVTLELVRRLREAEKDAARYRFLRNEHGLIFNAPIAQVVWKRESNPQGEWVNLIDAVDLDGHLDAALAVAATGAPK